MMIKIGKILRLISEEISKKDASISSPKIAIDTPHISRAVLGSSGSLSFLIKLLAVIAEKSTAKKSITPGMMPVETKATDKTAGI